MNFPFLDGDVPRSASYGVYISQLIRVHYLFQFYVVWILRLINFTIELTDYMMLLYLQGIILNLLFVQSSIPKLIILDVLLKFLSLI